MKKLLTVPNWSIGRERAVIRQVRDLLESAPVDLHYCQADIDHNRTVTAFSGSKQDVKTTLFHLADLILPAIDLQRHRGVHPRIGGLDVCPFIPLPDPVGEDALEFGEWVDGLAQEFAERFDIPVYLYEKSEKGHHRADLPSLRRGGFGGLLDKTLKPDFGPDHVHPHLGATVLGWRNFLIAFNINYRSQNSEAVERIAQKIRQLRREKNPNFLGVRALGLTLSARELVQVSLNVTKPDLTPLDPIIEFIEEMANRLGLEDGYPELIGVIRDVDIERSVKIMFRPEQVIETRLFTNSSEPPPHNHDEI